MDARLAVEAGASLIKFDVTSKVKGIGLCGIS